MNQSSVLASSTKMRIKIAIVGTQGLPSKYGGFETLVYYLVNYLSDEYDITVFCSAPEYSERIESYNGAKLKYIGLKANGIQSIPYDVLSILKSCRSFDKVLILGSSGGVILPFLPFFKKKFIMNFGGLDWKRSKWSYLIQRFLKFSEKLSIKFSKHIVADNEGISNYIQETYGKSSDLIAYGGDQAKFVDKGDWIKKHPFLIKPYAFSLARIQSDNNIEMILDAFDGSSKMPLIFVGNWNSSSYGQDLKQVYSDKENVVLLDAIYDQKELNALRSNSCLYIHGHSAGGTNPALVEAMNLALPILAFSSGFNEFTTKDQAFYFSDSNSLRQKVEALSNEDGLQCGSKMRDIALKSYQWKDIASAYAEIFDR